MSLGKPSADTRIDERYGRLRYGDPGKVTIREREALDDVREQHDLYEDVTPREALGAGLQLTDAFDFVIEHGTMQTMAGFRILGRDLAFRIAGVGKRLLGDRIKPRLLSELELRVAEIVTDDNRVKQLYKCSAARAGTDTVEVTVGLLAETDEKHEFIFPVTPEEIHPPRRVGGGGTP